MADLTEEVLKLNPLPVSFTATDYFNWLIKSGIDSPHRIDNRKAYLVERFKFKVEEDTISAATTNILSVIEAFYFRVQRDKAEREKHNGES